MDGVATIATVAAWVSVSVSSVITATISDRPIDSSDNNSELRTLSIGLTRSLWIAASTDRFASDLAYTCRRADLI